MYGVRLAALAAAMWLISSPVAMAQRAELPIREVMLSDGARRYAVTLTIGSATVEAGLDTGSSGLRVLPGVLAAADATPTSRSSHVSYGAGVVMDGTVATANVVAGGLADKIELQLVDRIGCRVGQPDCAAKALPLADFRIQGDGLHGEGFKAILGANMGGRDMASPLSALGAKRWIVELPPPNSGKRGRLILNPTDEEAAGYTRFRIDPAFAKAGGMHDAIPACLMNLAAKTKVCAPTLLDSGAPGIVVINGPEPPAWPNGAPAALAFGDPGSQQRVAIFAIGQRTQASRLTFRTDPQIKFLQIHAGLTPYFAFSVLYDPAAGELGLKPRADGTVKGE